jgi:methylthioribose-1-phosphate isomerase
VLVDGVPYRSLWLEGGAVHIIDQRRLPAELVTAVLTTVDDVARAIREMWLRGAPLIGVAGAHGLALAVRHDPSDGAIERAAALLLATRPTAVNLRWAVDQMRAALVAVPPAARADTAFARAQAMADADAETCRLIGEQGLPLLGAAEGSEVRVLTHCNAGWLATIDWGTALAPIYLARARGLAVHVWVSETRPRNQGGLTAWELGKAGVPHTLVADNACGHLLQRGMVDVVLVGADRVTARGDVANKVGTYLKALAARAHGVPFYVAAPMSTIDFGLGDGAAIPIEERDGREVTELAGARLAPEGTPARNWAFDVTPAALVSGLVTERGVAPASTEGLERLRR